MAGRLWYRWDRPGPGGGSWLTAGRSPCDDLLTTDDYGINGIDLVGAGSQQVRSVQLYEDDSLTIFKPWSNNTSRAKAFSSFFACRKDEYVGIGPVILLYNVQYILLNDQNPPPQIC